jgi:hypothetical protein
LLPSALCQNPFAPLPSPIAANCTDERRLKEI